MPLLHFPSDRIVGTVSWAGSGSDGSAPVLATGPVDVPDGVAVSLDISAIECSEARSDRRWRLISALEPIDLGFLAEVPGNAVQSLTVRSADEASFACIALLAAGLRRLCLPAALGGPGFSDDVLPTVAQLTGLVYLQTFGNDFTDSGVQRLAALVNLEQLYLEEATLTLAAFDFVDQLPRLTRLGLMDVPLGPADLRRLRRRLPGVAVG